MAARLARLLAAVLGAVELTRGEYATWHLVDVPAVVCTENGAPGYSDINITFTTQNMDVESLNSPHIFTFFRSSNNNVAVALRATDSMDRLIDQRTIDLSQVTPTERRLNTQDEDDEEREDRDEAENEEEEDDEDMYELQEAHEDSQASDRDEEDDESPHADMSASERDPRTLPEVGFSANGSAPNTMEYDWKLVDVPVGDGQKGSVPARRLSGRRRGGGGGSRYSGGSRSGGYSRSRTSSPRRRSSNSGSRRSRTVSPRRRGVSPRRRGAPTQAQNARRRGYTAPGARRRAAGVGGSSHYNKYSPNSGSYAYTSQGRLNNNFGGRPPTTTGYGYAGANAYKSSSGTKIAMAAAGGLALGVGGAYLYSRWASYPGYHYGMGGWGNCYYGSIFSGPCSTCYGMYSSGCYSQYSPNENMARDDLMATGWIPADYSTPMTVRITQVLGPDYTAARICPPKCWHPNASLDNCTTPWVAPTNQDLFMTLTKVSPLSDDDLTGGDLDDDVEDSPWAIVASVLISCCFCACCIGGAMMIMQAMRSGPKRSRGVQMRGAKMPVAQPAPAMPPMTAAPLMTYQAPAQVQYMELQQVPLAQPVAGPGLVATPYVQQQVYMPVQAQTNQVMMTQGPA